MAASNNMELNTVMEDIIIPDHLYCPICTQIMKNPVQLNGNKQYTFCAFCISQWLNLKKSNPMTNEPLAETVLIPDNALNSEIKEIYSTAKEKCDWLIIQSNQDQNENNRLEAIAAKKWFDDKLFHLKSSYEWTPWMQQTALDAIHVLMNKLCSSKKPKQCEYTPEKVRVRSDFHHCYKETSEINEGEQEYDHCDDADHYREELTESEILECIEYIENNPDEFEDEEEDGNAPGPRPSLIDEKSINMVEQIRAEGKKLIDNKCNETIQRIQTLSYDGDKTEQIIEECQHSVTFVSSIISGIGKAIKGLTGWISEFFLFYVKKVLDFLALAGCNGML